jgi:hypothetical protein
MSLRTPKRHGSGLAEDQLLPGAASRAPWVSPIDELGCPRVPGPGCASEVLLGARDDLLAVNDRQLPQGPRGRGRPTGYDVAVGGRRAMTPEGSR